MLYADIDGKFTPVAVNEESNRYQVSWGEEHEKVRTGKYVIRLYDEDGYSAVRKVGETYFIRVGRKTFFCGVFLFD